MSHFEPEPNLWTWTYSFNQIQCNRQSFIPQEPYRITAFCPVLCSTLADHGWGLCPGPSISSWCPLWSGPDGGGHLNGTTCRLSFALQFPHVVPFSEATSGQNPEELCSVDNFREKNRYTTHSYLLCCPLPNKVFPVKITTIAPKV